MRRGGKHTKETIRKIRLKSLNYWGSIQGQIQREYMRATVKGKFTAYRKERSD